MMTRSRGVRGPRGIPETRYSSAEMFGRILKASYDLAKQGRCREATKNFKRAVTRGRDLADALPNARREIDAKLRMVERQLLASECSLPRKYYR